MSRTYLLHLALPLLLWHGVAVASNYSVPIGIQGPDYILVGQKAGLATTTLNPSQSNLLRRVKWYETGPLLYDDSAAPFLYDFTNSTRGTHTVNAMGYDASSILLGSVYKSISVLDVHVALNSNGIYSATCRTTLPITANVTGADTVSVASVKWYLNNSLVEIDTTRPYQYAFSSDAPSINTIRAEAYHTTGLMLDCASGTVTVAHGPITLTATPASLDYLGGSSATITAAGDCLQNLAWQRTKDGGAPVDLSGNATTQLLLATESPGTYVFKAARPNGDGETNSPPIQIVDRRPRLWAAVFGPAFAFSNDLCAYSVRVTGAWGTVNCTWLDAESSSDTNASYRMPASGTKAIACTVADGRGSLDASLTTTVISASVIQSDIVDEPPSGNTYASGVNTNSIVLTLNGTQVIPTLTTITNGVHIQYSPAISDLVIPGSNTVTLKVRDNSNGAVQPSQDINDAGNPTDPDPATWSFQLP